MTTHTTFTREIFAAFRADNRPGPIHMLNLIRLRETAVYPSGEKVSGVEAYASYGRISGPVFTGLGGKIIWRGQWELEVIGPADERWDICFIAEYPSVASFAEMAKNPVYREAVVHRTAAVLDSRLIRLAPSRAGSTFSG